MTKKRGKGKQPTEDEKAFGGSVGTGKTTTFKDEVNSLDKVNLEIKSLNKQIEDLQNGANIQTDLLCRISALEQASSPTITAFNPNFTFEKCLEVAMKSIASTEYSRMLINASAMEYGMTQIVDLATALQEELCKRFAHTEEVG